MALVPPAAPKRNSGRTGRRRLTAKEAALHGRQAERDHIRRYGHPVGTGHPMPPAPVWFTAPMLAIWDAVLASAPAGVLHRADYDNLVVLVGAVHRHHTLAAAWLAYRTAEPPILPPPELERRVRLAGAEVNRASLVLGLTPGRRSGVPEAAEPADPFMRFVPVRPDA